MHSAPLVLRGKRDAANIILKTGPREMRFPSVSLQILTSYLAAQRQSFSERVVLKLALARSGWFGLNFCVRDRLVFEIARQRHLRSSEMKINIFIKYRNCNVFYSRICCVRIIFALVLYYLLMVAQSIFFKNFDDYH